MLHGEIRVNGDLIGQWSARRLVRVPEEENTYECAVRLNGEEPVTFALVHTFEDGALVLASRVLEYAASERRNIPE